MKNKPNFFFDNRGFPNWGGGWRGSAAWEFFPHNPVFSDNVPKCDTNSLKKNEGNAVNVKGVFCLFSFIILVLIIHV